jgi:hypothetical protein
MEVWWVGPDGSVQGAYPSISATVTWIPWECPPRVANPDAETSYSPAPATAPLFHTGGPSYLDVEQGQVGDCWLMASLAEVAARDPQDIKNMFTYDGTTVDHGATVGLYTVRLFDTVGFPCYFQVDTDLPSGGGYPGYAQVTNTLGTQALWVALAEKAYAEANSLGYVTTNNPNQDSYAALDHGEPAWALQAITGKSASNYSINPTDIASAWNAGDLIVLSTITPNSQYIFSGHAYAVVGHNPLSYPNQPFEVFNPWGTDSSSATPSTPAWAPNTGNTIYGLFWASPSFITQNFTSQTFGTGAMDVNDIDRAVDELTELAALGGDYGPSGTIHLTRSRPGGGAVGAATATFDLGKRMAIGSTRPAQGTATGVDLGVARDAGDGGDPTTSGLQAPRNRRW